MSQTRFSGPIVSTGGFTGALTGAVTATTASASTSLTVGGGTAITKIVKGTVTVDPASINTLAVGEVTATLTGAAAGDVVTVNPPAAGIDTGLVVCDARVSATDQIKIRIYNSTGGSVDVASGTWLYTLMRS